MTVNKTIKLFIGGQFPRSESGRTFPAYDFQSKKILAHICQASRKDLRNAVEQAQKAQSSWTSRSAYNRGQILYRMAEMMEGKKEELSTLWKQAYGGTEKKAQDQVRLAIDSFVYYAGFADKYQHLLSTLNPVSGPYHNFTQPQAMGVVGVLPHQDGDLFQVISQCASLIACGNCLIVLLPEKMSILLSCLGEMMATSDLPAGVINFLSGFSDELLETFSTHREIDALLLHRPAKKTEQIILEKRVGNLKRVLYWDEANPLSLAPLEQASEFKTFWHPRGY